MPSTSAVAYPAPSVWGRLARGVPAALGAAVFTTLLLSLLGVDSVPAFVTAALVLFAALAGWRPDVALQVLAAAIPIAAWTGRTWDGYVAWPETLAVAFAAGYLARPLWTKPRARDGLDLPIAFFTAVVLASLAVRLLVLHWTIGGEALW